MADSKKHTEGPWERVDTSDYAEIHPAGKRLRSAIALVAKPEAARDGRFHHTREMHNDNRPTRPDLPDAG